MHLLYEVIALLSWMFKNIKALSFKENPLFALFAPKSIWTAKKMLYLFYLVCTHSTLIYILKTNYIQSYDTNSSSILLPKTAHAFSCQGVSNFGHFKRDISIFHIWLKMKRSNHAACSRFNMTTCLYLHKHFYVYQQILHDIFKRNLT